MEGMAATKALLDKVRCGQRALRRGARGRRDERAHRRAGRAAGEDRRLQRLGARPHRRDRHGRAALPAGRFRCHHAVGRRAPAASRSAGCCCSAPTCSSSTSRPTISTPNRFAWLERFLHDYPGTVVTVTHDRYFLDDVAGWILELDRGRGIPYEGNYTGWLEQKQKRSSSRASRRRRARPPWHASSNGCGRVRAPARRNRRRAHRLRIAGRPEQGEGARHGADRLPPGPRLGDLVIEAEHVAKGYGERLLIEDLNFRLPPAASSASSGRTAPARRRSSA